MFDKPYYVWRPRQLVRRLAHPGRRSSAGGVVSTELAWGGLISCWPDAIGAMLTRAGVYDLTTSEVLTRLTARGELVIDAGANVGCMTALLAWRAGTPGRVVAFEPHPGIAGVLRANSERWSALPWAPIEIRESAVSDRAGRAELTIDEQFAGNRGTASLSASGGNSRRVAEVCLERLDDVVGPRRVGVLKLDVEGHEDAALDGARRLLAGHRVRDILFEEHRPYPTLATDLLERAGYTLYTLDRSFFGPRLRSRAWRAEHTFDATSLVATADAPRLHRLLRPRGWAVLRGVRAP